MFIPSYKLYGLCQDISGYVENWNDLTVDDIPDPKFKNSEPSDTYFEMRVRFNRGKNVDNDTYDGTRELIWSYTNSDEDIAEIVGYLGNNSGSLANVTKFQSGLYCANPDVGVITFIGRTTNNLIVDLTGYGDVDERKGIVLFYNVATGDYQNREYDYNVFLALGGMIEQTTEYAKNFKLFKTRQGAVKYLATGDNSDEVESEDPTGDLAEDREVTLYYESDIFSRSYNSSTSTHIGASNIHFRVQYKNNKGEEIVNPYRAICGYVANNNMPNDTNRFGNIVWIANNNINLIETKQHPVSGTIAPSKSIPNYNNTTGFYPPYITNNTIYDARYRTNMRIFANEQDALNFLNGGNPTPIGESGNQFNPSGFIGDKTVFNDGHDLNGGGMSSCWIMNESQLEDLANVFTTGLTTVEEDNNGVIVNITKTCARAFASHGEPIDAVVDLFWIPFDPTEFVNTGASSFQLNRDDIASASSLIKVVTESGDTVKAYGQFSFGKSSEFVGSVVGSMGDMFSNTTQKVRNVSE